jgi:2-iminoacetate synthase ThiH
LVVEQKVKELQEKVGHLMIVILHRVTPKNEDGSEEAVVTTVKGIEEDITALVRCDL